LDSLDNYYTSSQCFDTAITETGIKPTLTAIDTLLLDWSNEDNWQIPYQREKEVYDLLKEMGATLLNGMKPTGKYPAAWLGKTIPDEMRRRISESLTGNAVSEETRKKISEFQKGNTWCLGHKHTEETKKKLSKNHSRHMLGKTHSEEARRKMSESRRGISPSEETKQKMSASNRGKTRTEESRKRISEGAKKGWANRKAAVKP
jgi:hypothetical protein